MQVVRAGLADHGDGGAAEASFVRGETVGEHAEFLDGVRIWRGIAGVAQAVDVAAAVQAVVHRADAGVGRSVDHRHLHRRAEIVGGLVGGIYASRQVEQRIDVAIDQRKVVDFRVGSGLAESRHRSLHHRCVGVHFHRFRDRANLQRRVHPRVAVDVQRDAGLVELLEAGGVDFHLVIAHRKEQQRIAAVARRRGRLNQVRAEVGGNHLGAGNGCARTVGDVSGNRRGGSLTVSRGRPHGGYPEQRAPLTDTLLISTHKATPVANVCNQYKKPAGRVSKPPSPAERVYTNRQFSEAACYLWLADAKIDGIKNFNLIQRHLFCYPGAVSGPCKTASEYVDR